MEQYGDALVCVRYRYYGKTQKQYKTVEIIVNKREWTPSPANYTDGAIVSLKISIKETVLQEQVKAVGGRWNKEQQIWLVAFGCIAGTKLEKFIAVETTDCVKKVESL